MDTPTRFGEVDRKATLRKITLRLMPFIFLMYLVNYVDRTALGFANANGMSDELQLTATMFGFASGIFFIGYIMLEIPSNVMMSKVGANIWLSRIAISWGILAAATAFVPSFEWLLAARFFLGVAEAGFAPAIFLYLTYWFSNRERGKAFSLFLLGIPISSVITAPLASWLIVVGDGFWGLSGWRFMLLVTGIPAVLVGIAAFFYLTNRPAEARWLTPAERAFVEDEIRQETRPEAHQLSTVWLALRSPKVWTLGVAYMGIVYALYAVGFFAPGVVAAFAQEYQTTFTTLQNGLILAIPYAIAAFGMVFWARRSAKKQEVGRHVLVSTIVGAIGILIAAYVNNPWMVMVGVALCATGIISSMPVIFTLPAKLLSGAGAAAGLALVNSIGNVGGFAGPFFTGWLKDLSGGVQLPFTVMACVLVVTGIVALSVQIRTEKADARTVPVTEKAVGAS